MCALHGYVADLTLARAPGREPSAPRQRLLAREWPAWRNCRRSLVLQPRCGLTGQVQRLCVCAALVTICCGMLASCDPSPAAWAEAKTGAASSSFRPAVADAAQPATVDSNPTPKKAARTPPKLPYSPRRACGEDSDCAIVPARPCMCRECGTSWHEVLNKSALRKLQASWAKKRCRLPECPKCESHLLGTKAVCHVGQCAVE